jgi:hypothetical protein
MEGRFKPLAMEGRFKPLAIEGRFKPSAMTRNILLQFLAISYQLSI